MIDLNVEKGGDGKWITVCDEMFNDDKEHLQRFYGEESYFEFPELLEYYKYYSQEAFGFFGGEFQFLSVYHEKKKGILYRQLKKELNLSESEVTITENGGEKMDKKNDNFSNMLSGIQFTENKDESYLVNEILERLENHFGPSRTKTIEKLDNEFRLPNKVVNAKIKTQPRESIQPLNNKMIESTNCSISKGVHSSLKKEKLNTHRKFDSCPKNVFVRELGKEEKEKKTNKIRRRKSVEIVSSFDSNVDFHKNETKKKESIKNEKGKEKFYEKMEEVRKKIRQEKENILRKPYETILTGRKKMNKVKK